MDIERYKKETALLPSLPGVEAVFLSGSIAQGIANSKSDIDLFIIARPRMIWTARFFVYMYLLFIGKMRRFGNEAGKYCPNHFITSDVLEIQEQDAYSAHLFSHNIPLYDMNNIFVQFKEVNKKWVKSFGENFQYKIKHSAKTYSPPRKRSWWGHVESILKHLQTNKIKRHPNYTLPGAKIILTDTELRFHAHPRNLSWKK